MASIRLKSEKSQYYYACYTDRDGVQRQKSTKTTDKKLAQQIADALETSHREKRTVTQLRRTFSELKTKINVATEFEISVRQYFEQWLREIRGEQHPDTFTRYNQILRDSLQEMGSEADEPLDAIEKSTFIKVRTAVAERTSNRNANIYLKVLKRVMRSAVENELRGSDPTRSIKLLNTKDESRDERRPFSETEMSRLKAVLTGEWPLMVHFGEQTGQRLGDIACCTRQQLDLDAKIWEFVSQKTGREMRVPLTPSLVDALRRLPPASPTSPIFPKAFAEKRDKNGQSRSLSAAFRKFLEIAGLAPNRSKKNTGKGHRHARRTSELSFHCFRHNANSALKLAKVAETVVRDIIGHESELISRKYTHIPDEAKVAAIEAIDRPLVSAKASL